MLQSSVERGITMDRRGWELMGEQFVSDLKVTPTLLLCGKNGDPRTPRGDGVTRAALEMTGRRLRGRRVPVWTIGKAAILHLKIEQLGPGFTPIRAEEVSVKTDEGRFHPFDFEEETITPLESVIRVPLAAPVIHSPGHRLLRFPNEDIGVECVKLEFRIKIRIGEDQTNTYATSGILYCKAEKKKLIVNIRRRVAQGRRNMKQKMPQSIRNLERSFVASLPGFGSKRRN